MSENQYDSLLGGSIELPTSLNLLKTTAARAREINEMRKTLNKTTGTKLAFQKLPKHMRRRVMSHNAKRLPRRLREIHLSQLTKSGMPPKQKRPTRKFRRRPENLRAEYTRRKRRITWLETHVWHAKRFHMVEKWGYKLADRPCDKAFRACYRASAKHCLLQDVSYYNCVEIKGDSGKIIEGIRSICDGNTLGVNAKAFIKGNREGKLFLINRLGRPIGNVSFIWKPFEDSEDSDFRMLWLWVHPAFYPEVYETLLDVFHLNDKMETDDINTEMGGESKGKEIEESKGKFKELREEIRGSRDGIMIKQLKFDLNRFSLTGPLANSTIHKALVPAENPKGYIPDGTHSKQKEYYKEIENFSCAELHPHMVLSIMVKDPRCNLPSKRTKALPDSPAIGDLGIPDLEVSSSPIWSEEVRRKVKEEKPSEIDLMKRRSELLVPGSELPDLGTVVPVMLINKGTGYAAGWDVVIPAGWGQSFWSAFVMWGARSGGLRETDTLRFEMGLNEVLPPDTEAGRREEEEICVLRRKRYFSLPPNKRTNYRTISIESPFSFNWNLLLSEWSRRDDDNPQRHEKFVVMRDLKSLNAIQEVLSGKPANHEMDFDSEVLIPVRLKLRKGRMDQLAVICLPKLEDLGKKDPVEPLTVDSNYSKRVEMREKHRTLLKRMRRKDKRTKEEMRNSEALKDYKEAMERLWLPDAKTIRNSCSREVIGFVKKGNFSFTQGQSIAVGYIVLGAVKQLICSGIRDKVLVRNTTSRHYRFADISVIK